MNCIGLDDTNDTKDVNTDRTDRRWRFGEVVNGNPRQRYVRRVNAVAALDARVRRERCMDECDRVVVSISFEKEVDG